MADYIARFCPDCCAPPGQPCTTGCTQCRLGTKVMRHRVTISGVVDRPSAQDPAIASNDGKYVPPPTCDASTTLATWHGDVVTDKYGCLALNDTFDTPNCPVPCGGDVAVMCVSSGSPCSFGSFLLNTIEAYYNPNSVASCGFCDPFTLDGTVGFPAGFNPSDSTSYKRYEVKINFRSTVDRSTNTCLYLAPDYTNDTQSYAVFRLEGEEADPEATESDCRGVKVLTQVRTESPWVPCDFSGATVTVEALEYFPTVPNTIFLSIVSTGSLNGEVVQLDWDEGLAQWLGSVVIGGCTINFYFGCNGTITDQCEAQPIGNFQLLWDGNLGCTVTAGGTTSTATTTFFPFLWEAGPDTITINGVGQLCDFTITE